MSLEMSYLIELWNPLYYFPIIGVVFCALLVYAFGFKSPTLPPNFDQFQHKKIITKKKKINKESNNKLTTGKSQQNGVINTGAVKVSDKKNPQKKVTANETKSSPLTDKKVVNNKIGDKKDKIKKRTSDEQKIEAQDIEDKDSGEWVELISKKERKNRKQKEEQMLNELQETNVKTKPLTSPKKQKKGKENKDKNDKNVKLDSNANIDATKATDNKQIRKEANDKSNIKQEKTVKDEELIAEDPDIYELVKEQRVPKKAQKNRINKRNSESEITPKVESLVEKESNVNQTDKLTASIVANYEANDQNKPDSLSTANNKKKKDKNKKKQSQTSTNNATTDKQVVNKDNKNAFTPVIETESAVNTVVNNEVKPSEDDDFKLSVSKKRRARRE